MRARYKWLLGLLLAIGVPYYWLLLDNRPGDAPPPPLAIAELRRAAETIPGPKPAGLAAQTVGWRRLPGTLFVAGGGIKRVLIGVQAFALEGPWGTVVIDAGLGAADAREMQLEHFIPAHQRLVDAALRRARLIVFTHEHADHIAGLLRLPDFAAVAPRALITPEQLGGNRWSEALPWPRGSRRTLAPFRYRRLAPIAPGVVLIRTPGHTPGSQMIYARLADGRELLFTGDTATTDRSWRELRARSRLVGDWIAPEDRAAVFGWLKAIRALKREAPGLIVIAGHDPETLNLANEVNRFALSFAAPR